MRIVVDAGLCEVHGECVVAAPDLFDLEDDAEIVTVKVPRPAPDQEELARKAVHVCPVGALSLED